MSDPIFSAPVTNPFGLSNVRFFSSPTFVDLDGDGDLDALVGNLFGNTLFDRNTGSATNPVFSASSTNPFGLSDVGLSANPTFVDLDGDGDLDALVGNSYGNTMFYRNTGSTTVPVFDAPLTNPFGLNDVGSLANPTLADLDGDGDLDALIGNSAGDTLFYRNSGSATAPAFTAPVTNPFGLSNVGSYANPTFVDLDGDGDLDALVGNSDGDILYYVNTVPDIVISPSGGNTQVTEGGATDNYTIVLGKAPTANVTIALHGGTQLSTNVPSLIFTPANWNIAQTVTVTAINDGIGEGPHQGVITHSITSSDLNYSGLIIPPISASITDNDLPPGDPGFTPSITNPFGLSNVGSNANPTFVDLDGDGDLDALIGNNAGDTLFYRNTGSTTAPAFSASLTNPFGLSNVGTKASPTFIDLDGDGDLDALIGNNAGDTLYYHNTGSTTAPAFAAPSTNPFGLSNVGSIADPTFADLDGDGDLDALIGNNAGDTLYYVNANNLPPVANSDTIITNAGIGVNFLVPEWALLRNDSDPDSSIDLSPSALGIISTTDATATHTDGTGTNGFITAADTGSSGGSFDYAITDSLATVSATATISQDTIGALNGTNGVDILIGKATGSTIDGGAGNDILVGGNGNDTLKGRSGSDILVGGTGNNTFIFSSKTDLAVGTLRDVIRDFKPGAGGDIIDVNLIDANTKLIGNQSFMFIGGSAFSAPAQIRAVSDGASGTILKFNTTGTSGAELEIQITGVAPSSFSATLGVDFNL